MSDAAQIVVVVAAIFVGIVLVLRLVAPMPGRIRRSRRPETRVIRVIGVGGGGSNAVDRMVAARIPGVSFVACNTDAQALRRSKAGTKVRIGEAVTGGLGSGGDPDVGRRSAEENEAKIARIVAGADLVFITAGLGGGTGSGAAPIIGANARIGGALTIAVVTKPFAFEGTQRRRVADAAAAELAANVDAIITIPNDRVVDVITAETTMLDAFGVVDDVLLQAVQGIVDLLRGPGLINLDFADVRAVMQGAGPALIGLGRAGGEDRAITAAREATTSPLLEARIQGARGILFNVSGPADLRLGEVRAAADEIRSTADPDANIIFGASLSRRAGDEVLVTLIATGLGAAQAAEAEPAPQDVAERTTTSEPASEPATGGSPVNGARKRAARAAAPTPSDTPPDAAKTTHAARAAEPATTPDDEPPAAQSADEEVDLDVPSFLRRKPS